MKTAKIKPSSKSKRKKLIILAIIVVILTPVLVYAVIFLLKTYKLIHAVNPNVVNFLTPTTQETPKLTQDENGLTNALIIGIDTRENDQGLQNTDTMIVATLNNNKDVVTMLSIPRDLLAENPVYPGDFIKINSIYTTCESYNPGTGIDCLRAEVEKITGLTIHYYGMVDIQGLVKIVDILGGVDIDVENPLIDCEFPAPDGEWELVSFEKGPQHMDGTTAMKFARTRECQSTEGSDYARARRQQKVITAMKDKMLSAQTLSNPIKVIEILDQLGSSVKTSAITRTDIEAARNTAEKIKTENIYGLVLDPIAGNWTLIQEDNSTGTFTLVPQEGLGNWNNIQQYVQYYLENPGICSEMASIFIYNGGIGYDAAYAKFQELSAQYPYLWLVFGGNYTQDVTGNVIYSFTEKPKIATLDVLDTFFATEWTKETPMGIASLYGENIAVVLGGAP